jgi:3'(2'), 5'-bisphosphate nucleotidase
MRDLTSLARALIPIAVQAGEAIMKIYNGKFAVEHKADNSPLTLADLESQRVIIEGLSRLTPEIPVLSEESAEIPWEERRHWRELWVVDPLDGTREFIKRNGEFTVNIALIVDHEPVLGVVGAPAQGVLYWGAAGSGAYKLDQRIQVSPTQQPLRVVGSRSHLSPETAHYLEGLADHRMLGIGSSLKFCLIASGDADLYPRFGPTSEWDTAAGQAVLEAAGGQVTRPDGHRLRYNCRESILNGDFVAFGHPSALASRSG